MPNPNTYEATEEEKKHLIGFSKGITEGNEYLLELIKNDKNISTCIVPLLHFAFKIDQLTNNLFIETEKKFREEILELNKKH